MSSHPSSRFSVDLAVDLGTAISLVYMRGKGIVLREPSVVALKRDNHGLKRVLAVGEEAKRMLGRVPEDIEAVRPLKDGVIADFEVAELMLQHFIAKAHRRAILKRPRLIISVPSGATQVERRAVREAAQATRVKALYFIAEPLAAAIGAGLRITEPTCSMIVDIGGGTTEAAVISLSGIVYSKSVRMGGDKMDQAIIQYVRNKYNLLIGEGTAETLKMAVASACPMEEEATIEVKGRDLMAAIPKSLTISSEEVREAIGECIATIVETVRTALEQMPPELAADIVDRGIILTGGGALVKNMDVLLRNETHLPVIIADDPLSAVALGAGKALEDVDLFRDAFLL
jgi:rod shape-determining protein MreB